MRFVVRFSPRLTCFLIKGLTRISLPPFCVYRIMAGPGSFKGTLSSLIQFTREKGDNSTSITTIENYRNLLEMLSFIHRIDNCRIVALQMTVDMAAANFDQLGLNNPIAAIKLSSWLNLFAHGQREDALARLNAHLQYPPSLNNVLFIEDLKRELHNTPVAGQVMGLHEGVTEQRASEMIAAFNGMLIDLEDLIEEEILEEDEEMLMEEILSDEDEMLLEEDEE